MQRADGSMFIEKFRQVSFFLLFLILGLLGLFCVIWLLSIPSNPGGLIFGLSLNRLLLISLPLVSSIFFLALLLVSYFKAAAFQIKLKEFINQKIAGSFLFLRWSCQFPHGLFFFSSTYLIIASSNISVSVHCL